MALQSIDAGAGIDSAQVQASCEAAVDAKTPGIADAVALVVPDIAGITAALPTVAQIAAAVPDDAAVQAAAAAALSAEVGGALITAAQVTSAVPTAAGIATAVGAQAACAAAITAANLPTAAQVASAVGAQAACAAALTAAAGAAIPSVAQIQSGLSTSSALSTLQTTCSALPSAAAIAATVAAQASCAAAITAAAGVAIPTVQQITDGVDGLNIAGSVYSSVPPAVAALAVGVTPVHTTVTLSGAGTSGTLLAAQGLGLRAYVVAVLVSCTAAQSVFQMVSSGGTTMGSHSLLQNSNLSLSIPFSYILRSGSNTSITVTKTTGATLVIDVYYYVA